MPSLQASADIPDNLTDLVYQNAQWGGDQLRARGDSFINSDYHNGRLIEYWRQGSSRTCLQARAVDGKYEGIKATAGTDSKSVAEFDRGYRDGLYNQTYHNFSNKIAYSDGYSAGSHDRYERTSYRPQHGRYSGYHPYVSLDDLVGASAASADSQLRSRGFRDTGGYKQGNKACVTWYNRSTRQCVQALTRDGRIKRLESIDEGNCL